MDLAVEFLVMMQKLRAELPSCVKKTSNSLERGFNTYKKEQTYLQQTVETLKSDIKDKVLFFGGINSAQV